MENNKQEEQQQATTEQEAITDTENSATQETSEQEVVSETQTTEKQDEEIVVEEISEEQRLKEELAEFKNKYLRLYSDFDNYRKRTSKEKLQLIATAGEGIISSLLPILDDFERADKSFKDAENAENSLKEGFDLIYAKIGKTLEQKGLKAMECIGEDFDTELHEAIAQIPAPEEKMKGKVIDVAEKGYVLGEKVIRFAKVVIGS